MQSGTETYKKTTNSHRVKRPVQTGFSSPATHYSEPRIDLNEVLINNPSATFYVRVTDESYAEFEIVEDDVLIIDRSIAPKLGQLVFGMERDSFTIYRVDKNVSGELTVWGVISYIIKSVL